MYRKHGPYLSKPVSQYTHFMIKYGSPFRTLDTILVINTKYALKHEHKAIYLVYFILKT